jgi:hypothetical protein
MHELKSTVTSQEAASATSATSASSAVELLPSAPPSGEGQKREAGVLTVRVCASGDNTRTARLYYLKWTIFAWGFFTLLLLLFQNM